MQSAKVVCVWLMLGLLSAAQGSIPDTFTDLAPLVSRDSTLAGNTQSRFLGPLLEHKTDAAGNRFRAFRPFISIENQTNGQRHIECLWPLLTVRGNEAGHHWTALFAWGRGNTNAGFANRTTVFPIYFSGTDPQGKDFFAIFPLGGTIRHFLGQDLITFWAFPLYCSYETSSNRATSVLWPFVAWSKGARTERLRIFPFYMRSIRTDEWDKRAILWPFWTEAHYTSGPSTGDSFILFPLVGRTKLTDQSTWMFLPPLFRFSRNDAGYRAFNAPWPFIQSARYPDGSGKFYVWPLWGTRNNATGRLTFFLWPIGSDLRIEHNDRIIERLAILPIYFSERITPIPPSGTNATLRPPAIPTRYVKVWPLASYLTEADRGQFRMLDLWPGKWASPIERNYAPLWTLYRKQWTETSIEHEALWGAFKYRTEGSRMTRFAVFPFVSVRKEDARSTTRRYSFLAGLFQYKREGLQRTYRALYFLKFKRGQPAPSSDSP